MKTVACIIARTNSTRLPKKVLLDFSGKTEIEYIIDNMKKVKGIDVIYIATSTNPDDQILGSIAEKNSIKVYYGSERSVIDRMLEIAKIEKADNVIRITGDNVFTDPDILGKTIHFHNLYKAEYSRAEYLSIGVTAEVIETNALKKCYTLIDPNNSEYLFYYIFDPEHFKTLVLKPNDSIYNNVYTTLTLDTPNDLERTRYIFSTIKGDVSYSKIIKHMQHDEIPFFKINQDISIKLPEGKSISYGEFRKIIDKRISNSIIVPYDLSEENHGI